MCVLCAMRAFVCYLPAYLARSHTSISADDQLEGIVYMYVLCSMRAFVC